MSDEVPVEVVVPEPAPAAPAAPVEDPWAAGRRANPYLFKKGQNKRPRKVGRPRKGRLDPKVLGPDGVPTLPPMLRMIRSIFMGELRRLAKKVPRKWADNTSPGLTDSERAWIHAVFTSNYKLWFQLERIKNDPKAAKLPKDKEEDVPDLSADELQRLGKLSGITRAQ